ncbi:MAG: OFA family MFS transporter [Desulfobacterales bacterium]|nr:OFA family MFS transporter [Desulfobacterales bacterium]
MGIEAEKIPMKAWVVTFAGMIVNLCLGILYAWSVWSKSLIDINKAGQPMTGINEGWIYLTNAQAATPYSICVMTFAIFMVLGGKIHDKYGPRFGATIGGVFLAAGCIIAGMMKSYYGLIIGFGLMGGIGMGVGYAAPTPAALKWFGPQKRGLIAGLVVGGYGGAAIYISPLGKWLITNYGISGSFIGLGVLFAIIIITAGQFLVWPPKDYIPPGTSKFQNSSSISANNRIDWSPLEMLKTWQVYALIILFIGSTQSGLLIIANAAGILNEAAKDNSFFALNAWIMVSYGGLINALGRVVTGLYSDKIGRINAYTLNCGISAICLMFLPWVIRSKNIALLFVIVGIIYWQYGGGLSLLPSYTADFFGSKHLGLNYGIVFLGWGFGFFMAKVGGIIKDITKTLDLAFYISGGILIIMIILCRITKKPEVKS